LPPYFTTCMFNLCLACFYAIGKWWPHQATCFAWPFGIFTPAAIFYNLHV
jgi:hypothetical protein